MQLFIIILALTRLFSLITCNSLVLKGNASSNEHDRAVKLADVGNLLTGTYGQHGEYLVYSATSL
jgi:hypothetical protein